MRYFNKTSLSLAALIALMALPVEAEMRSDASGPQSQKIPPHESQIKLAQIGYQNTPPRAHNFQSHGNQGGNDNRPKANQGNRKAYGRGPLTPPHQPQNGPEAYQTPDSQHGDPYNGWRNGERAPRQYRQPEYRVNDWRHRNLSSPPRGYRWVRNDNNQYILMAIVGGLIANAVNQSDYPETDRWYRGDRLDQDYRSGDYVVPNWRQHRLHRPARGQRWVHVNDQYLLIAITTGLILETILSAN